MIRSQRVTECLSQRGIQRPSSHSTEAQRGEETCPRSHSKSVAESNCPELLVNKHFPLSFSQNRGPGGMDGGEGPRPIHRLEFPQIQERFGLLSGATDLLCVSHSLCASLSSSAKETTIPVHCLLHRQCSCENQMRCIMRSTPE